MNYRYKPTGTHAGVGSKRDGWEALKVSPIPTVSVLLSFIACSNKKCRSDAQN